MAQGARNSKGVRVHMINTTATATDISADVDSVTAAAPAVLVGTGFTAVTGEYVYIDGTGVSAIDGQFWPVGEGSSATNIILLGSDNSAGGTTLDVGFTADLYTEADFIDLCLSSLEISRDVPGTISTATFCDTTSTVSNVVVQAGTVAIGGFVDVTSADYSAILAADADGAKRTFRLYLPDNGYLVFQGTIAGFNIQVPVDGALTWTAQITLSTAPKHRY
jgi:hypothetical protein